MSQLKVNALVSYSGNTVTLGTSGDTINVASNVTFNTSSNVVLPAGAAGTPSLTTQGDTNTGIFFPAADTIAFTEGGTEAMRIDSSGNLAIGTTAAFSDGSGVEIQRAGVATLRCDNSTATSAGEFRADATGTAIDCRGLEVFRVLTGGAERIRINSVGNVQFAGNIGLGGATPTTSGTGITFPATQSASTDANTLDDYEEGTFTPTITSGTGTITTTANAFGIYTKIGRQVTVSVTGQITNNGTGATYVQFTLPFTSSSSPTLNYQASGRENTVLGIQLQAQVVGGEATMQFRKSDNSYPGGTNYTLQSTLTYFI